MRTLSMFVALLGVLVPGATLALDGGLPLTRLKDGWLRIEGEWPVIFRWRVENPFIGLVERERAAEIRSSLDDCVWPDSSPEGSRARLAVEVEAADEDVVLDLGEPATVQLEGVFRDGESIVAAFTGHYSCTALGASGPVENSAGWWMAVRLAPSLQVLEHRRLDWASSDCWNNDSSHVMIEPAFEFAADRLWLRVRAWMFSCYVGGSQYWFVRWPVGEAPSCLEGNSSMEKPLVSYGPGASAEIATFGLGKQRVGRVFANAFAFPMAFAVALHPSEEVAKSLIELPLFHRTGSLAGYAVPLPEAPPLPVRDPAVAPRRQGRVYMATDEWPEALAACAAEFPSGLIERYADIRWKPLIEGEAGQIGLLSLPCQSWREDENVEGLRASWLIRAGQGSSTPVFAVTSCANYRNRFEHFAAPRVTVQVIRERRAVRLRYDDPVDPDWLRANRWSGAPRGDPGSLAGRLYATRDRGGSRRL